MTTPAADLATIATLLAEYVAHDIAMHTTNSDLLVRAADAMDALDRLAAAVPEHYDGVEVAGAEEIHTVTWPNDGTVF